MKKVMTNETPMFPSDMAKKETMDKVSEKLTAMANAETPKGAPVKNSSVPKMDDETKKKQLETIADDFTLTAEQADLIQRTEGIVRDLFQIMGGDYDALIAMNDKSPYAQAVRAHPAVLQHVKQAKNPVLEAVRLAVGFKPYQEFMEKYGETPEDIRLAMRKEFEDEVKASTKKAGEKEKTAEAESALNGSPVFSTYGAAAVSGTKNEGEDVISKLFKS